MAAGTAAILATVGVPPGGAGRLTVGAGAVLCLLGVVLTHAGWRRPFSDGMAWAGAALVLAPTGSWSGTLAELGGTAGVVALAMGLHHPAAAPPMRSGATLATWLAVGGAAALMAWWPRIWAGGAIEVLDPFTSAGLALRLAGVAAALALVASIRALRRGRQAAADQQGPTPAPTRGQEDFGNGQIGAK